MSIPVTRVHYFRVVDQCMQNVPGLQGEIRRLAQTWLVEAQTESVPLEKLGANLKSGASEFLRRLAWFPALQADDEAYAGVLAVLTQLGGAESDVTEPLLAMVPVVQALAAADVSTYAAIEVACAAVIDSVQAPVSLWPE